MATGGEPEETEANIDPDVAPHLMRTAPVVFTSNMTEENVNGIYKMNL